MTDDARLLQEMVARDEKLSRLAWEVEHLTKRIEKLELQVYDLNQNVKQELALEKEKCEKLFAFRPEMERIREVLFELRKVVYAVIGMICIGVLGAILKMVFK